MVLFPSLVVLISAVANAAFTPGLNHYGNYAGGVSYDSDIMEVSVNIVVPECAPGLPKYDYVRYQSNAWVGMSAFSGGDGGLLQTGVTCEVSEIEGNVTLKYSYWTEWAPLPVTFYHDKNIIAGDVVSARVVAHSPSSGSSYLTNLRTGLSFNTTYVNQTNILSFGDAEWIVESQLEKTETGIGGERNSDFNPWQFKDASYKRRNGTTAVVDKGDMVNCIFRGTQIFTAVFDSPGQFHVNNTTPADYDPRA